MDDLPDFDLRRTPTEPPAEDRPRDRPVGLWIAIGVVAVVIGAASYYAFLWKPRPAPAVSGTATAPARVSEPLPALGGKPDATTIPPLDASDSVVRTLVQALSESAAVMAWLPTNGLIRNFTVVVSNIADGATPAKQLRVLKPSAPFRVVDRGGTFADPRSYDRYNRIADAVTSIDPAGAAKLYATLKPRIEEAHRDLGASSESFDRSLERAIVALLDTPNLDSPPRLRPKGIGYGYADDRLEDLTAAQKQLLRMGPRNVRLIKARLREIALALGIPASHLPAR
jgi:hypothetical protein